MKNNKIMREFLAAIQKKYPNIDFRCELQEDGWYKIWHTYENFFEDNEFNGFIGKCIKEILMPNDIHKVYFDFDTEKAKTQLVDGEVVAMKNRYIEKDGLLFMKCEPEPLEVDSEMPCLVRLISDDSRVGKINKSINPHNIHKLFICDRVGKMTSSNGYNHYVVSGGDVLSHYCFYEIIAKHCPDGSVGWALWQMLNGKIVMRINMFKVCDNDVCYKESSGSWVASPFAIEEWLRTATQGGWKIYEEPKPETKPEVGKWYINKPSKKYYQHDSTSESNGYRFRQAGSTIFDMIGNSCFLEEFELAPIEPDFSNAKVCDYAFSTIQGSETIGRIDVQGGGRKIINDCYEVDGRFAPLDEHPVLFNSAAQCAAYFAEVALRER